VVRNPTLGATPYLARLMVRKVFGLSAASTESAVSPLSLASRLPERRIEVRAGKFGIADFFDTNSVLSDSHRQFTNWTVDNNGGYDYAADTRGYTYGPFAEVDTPGWSVRAAEALMPTVANGITLDMNLRRAHAENVELELRLASRAVLRLLGYQNHANMGSYTEAIDAFLAGRDRTPDIERHRTQGTIKYGVGLNFEQSIGRDVRVGTRAGWNEGQHESFAYTEVNGTLSAGVDIAGTRWRRAADRAGVALVSNGISEDHREYLRLGGSGFLLGDGTLRYGRETIVETYYTAELRRGVSVSGGVQHVQNPGYNRDRGPVTVSMARLHIDF
jgi:high affinity Mn2+ porin